MIVTVASYKGGVGKSTTAVHLAACLQEDKNTLLIDGDPNRSVCGWAKRGKLPFRVVDERQAARFSRDFEHIVIDTNARPERADLEALVANCDQLVIPTTPDALSIDALLLMLETLKELGAKNYRVLITKIPPPPRKDGDEARAAFVEAGIPLFSVGVPLLGVFDKAPNLGVLVREMKDRNAQRAWDVCVALSKELVR